MSNQLPKKPIYPDKNSWLSDVLIGFLKSFKNEYDLTLWEALNEYVSFHNPRCAYQGRLWEGELSLYPQVQYDPKLRKGTLTRLFFVSPHARTILAHDYMRIGGSYNDTPISNLMRKCFSIQSKEEEYPHLEFMVVNNNIEPALAKDILLQASYERRASQKLYVLENEALGIEYKNIDVAEIKFDLTMLEKCKFFNAKRYASFKTLLPEGLMLTLSWKIGYEIPAVPKNLRKRQLLDVTSITN